TGERWTTRAPCCGLRATTQVPTDPEGRPRSAPPPARAPRATTTAPGRLVASGAPTGLGPTAPGSRGTARPLGILLRGASLPSSRGIRAVRRPSTATCGARRPGRRLREQAGHERVDDLVGGRLRVDGRDEAVEDEPLDRVVEQRDLPPPAGEPGGLVERDVGVEPGARPLPERAREGGPSGGLEAELVEREGHLAVGGEAAHDVAHVRGEERAARRLVGPRGEVL